MAVVGLIFSRKEKKIKITIAIKILKLFELQHLKFTKLFIIFIPLQS